MKFTHAEYELAALATMSDAELLATTNETVQTTEERIERDAYRNLSHEGAMDIVHSAIYEAIQASGCKRNSYTSYAHKREDVSKISDHVMELIGIKRETHPVGYWLTRDYIVDEIYRELEPQQKD
jgi:hypothetical protein